MATTTATTPTITTTTTKTPTTPTTATRTPQRQHLQSQNNCDHSERRIDLNTSDNFSNDNNDHSNDNDNNDDNVHSFGSDNGNKGNDNNDRGGVLLWWVCCYQGACCSEADSPSTAFPSRGCCSGQYRPSTPRVLLQRLFCYLVGVLFRGGQPEHCLPPEGVALGVWTEHPSALRHGPVGHGTRVRARRRRPPPLGGGAPVAP